MPKQGGQDPESSGPRGEPRDRVDGTDPGGSSKPADNLPTTDDYNHEGR